MYRRHARQRAPAQTTFRQLPDNLNYIYIYRESVLRSDVIDDDVVVVLNVMVGGRGGARSRRVDALAFFFEGGVAV